MHRLILWDIDRTLVNIGGVSQVIYAAAFRAATGRDIEKMPDLAGRTDHDLVCSTLELHGMDTTDGMVSRFFDELAAATRAHRSDILAVGESLAGAADALAAFAGHAGVVQTVATGNLRPIAHEKLSLFGLDGPIEFEIGGYGSDDRVRSTLVRRARERAERKYRWTLAAERVVVIGDTPHDIAGALANGARAIGVATGRSTVDQLAAAGADVVLESLADTATVVRAALGEPPIIRP